jgi:MoaA/NifB/PqqE/SkfB family radical SAM enzyme
VKGKIMDKLSKNYELKKILALAFNPQIRASKDQIDDLLSGKVYRYILDNGKIYSLFDGVKTKACVGTDYNFFFDKTNGNFNRWGKTYEDDPKFSPIGPELIDLEISINGCPNNCSFCYKKNSNAPATNMSFETFKQIIDKVPKSVTQIAFGITGIQTNPDFIKMMEYCRSIGIIPNFTLSGIDLTDDMAEKVSKLVGAVAVSAYETNKNICYNTVKKFIDLGITQTNIHLMCSEQNEKFVYEVFNDYLTDPRLKKLNAIVILGVKPKGRAKDSFTPLSTEKFQKLFQYCLNNNIRCGFDSCTAPKFEYAVTNMTGISEEEKTRYISMSESCESFGLFSSYINTFGEYFPCSFAEGECGWEKGLSVLSANNFLEDIWHGKIIKEWRDKSLSSCYKSGCRKCLIFDCVNPKEME